jgi:outer membrane lipoprotein LolB
MHRVLRSALWAAMAGALAACAPAQRSLRESPVVMTGQRQMQLANKPRWSLEGRIAVSDGHDGGSGRLAWTQDGRYFDISVRAPVAGGNWRLSGDESMAQLDGAGPEPLRDRDAGALLARELGWHLPMGQVDAWVRGLPADPAQAQVEMDADGLPRSLREAGWQVDYSGWMQVDGAPMPRRMVARKAPFQVRIAVDRWFLHAAE